MDEDSVLLIYNGIKYKSSEELMSILEKNDSSLWSVEAFEAVRKVLSERNIEIPKDIISNHLEEFKADESLNKIICPECGGQLDAVDGICTNCDLKVQNQKIVFSVKSKKLAVILSIFLGPWSWLYTYGENGWKFWVSLSIGLFTGIIVDVISRVVNDASAIRSIAVIGLYLWPIIYNISKPNEFYDFYSTIQKFDNPIYMLPKLRITGIISFIFAIYIRVSSAYNFLLFSSSIPTDAIIFEVIISIIIIALSAVSLLFLFRPNEWSKRIFIFSVGLNVAYFLISFNTALFSDFNNYLSIFIIFATVISIALFIMILIYKRSLFSNESNPALVQELINYEKHVAKLKSKPLFFYIFGNLAYLIFLILFGFSTYNVISNIVYMYNNGIPVMNMLIYGIFMIFVIALIIFNYIYILKNKSQFASVVNILLGGIITPYIISLVYGIKNIFSSSYWFGVLIIVFCIFFIPWLIGIFGNRFFKRFFYYKL